MKVLLALLLYTSIIFCQTTTYSPEEEKMLGYVNSQHVYSMKYDSTELIYFTLDSCKKFLEEYPNSFAKPGIFTYMVEMTSLLPTAKNNISTLIDSALFYDKSSATKFRFAELLIEREIDQQKGYYFLGEIMDNLSVPYHKYKANILMARKSIREGRFSSAKLFFETGLGEDSLRAEGWYEYASFLQFSELPEDLERVKEKIISIDKAKKLKYKTYSMNSPNINKYFLDNRMHDLKGNSIEFEQFKGEPLLAQYFSNWCPQPKQYPLLEKIKKEFPNANIILINVLESPEELKSKYLNNPETEYLNDYPIVFRDSASVKKFSGMTMGTLFIIDESGNIKADLPGYSEEYEKIIRETLNKLNKK